MKGADIFPSNYVKADDLKDREVLVVIADAKIEKLGSDQKLVLHFQGKQKGMVCNKTNFGRIAYLYGDETDEWIGKEIVLCSEFVEYQGRTVKGLRVKPPARRGAPQMQHVVTEKKGYALSEMRPADPIEEMTGAATQEPPF